MFSSEDKKINNNITFCFGDKNINNIYYYDSGSKENSYNRMKYLLLIKYILDVLKNSNKEEEIKEIPKTKLIFTSSSFINNDNRKIMNINYFIKNNKNITDQSYYFSDTLYFNGLNFLSKKDNNKIINLLSSYDEKKITKDKLQFQIEKFKNYHFNLDILITDPTLIKKFTTKKKISERQLFRSIGVITVIAGTIYLLMKKIKNLNDEIEIIEIEKIENNEIIEDIIKE